jgi:Xaa-Pro aminopeptidase
MIGTRPSVNNELEIKTQRIVEMLEREKLDAVLLSAQHNFAWLTCGSSNAVDLSRENGAASLLVTRQGKRFILASVIEIQRMLEEEVSEAEFGAVEFSWHRELAGKDAIIKNARTLLESGSTIATDIEIDHQTRSIESKISACRYELTADEIDRYKLLGKDAGTAVRSVIDKIKPGETEIEIAAKFRSELASRNIISAVTLVAADERIAKFRHPVPTENRWKKTLMMVTCAKRHGLIASLSRIINVGEVSEAMQRKTEAAAFVNAKLTAATKPGVKGSELYELAAVAYAEKGFADEINLHHQGGATGYRSREWAAHPTSIETVQDTQAFAWNPSITGTKIEETIIIDTDGFQTITASPDFPETSVTIDGREFLSPAIFIM